MICLSKPEVEIVQLQNLQYLFTLHEATCVQNFVINGPLLTKLQQNTKYTNGSKFADPSLAAVSPYSCIIRREATTIRRCSHSVFCYCIYCDLREASVFVFLSCWVLLLTCSCVACIEDDNNAPTEWIYWRLSAAGGPPFCRARFNDPLYHIARATTSEKSVENLTRSFSHISSCNISSSFSSTQLLLVNPLKGRGVNWLHLAIQV